MKKKIFTAILAAIFCFSFFSVANAAELIEIKIVVKNKIKHFYFEKGMEIPIEQILLACKG